METSNGRPWAVGFLLAGLAVWPGCARAEIATFENVAADPAAFAVRVTGPYKGLIWSGIAVVKSTHRILAGCPRCGYRTGLVSGDSVAVVTSRADHQAQIVSASGRPFDFTGVHLTAGWKDDLVVQLQGLSEGKLLHSATVRVGTAQASSFSFDFRGIDSLRISASGGVDVGVCKSGCESGAEVVLDDFAFAFPDEPGSVAPSPQPAAAESPTTAMPDPAVVAPALPPAVTETRTAVPEPAVVAPVPPPVVTEPRTAVPEPAVVTPAPPPVVTETRTAVPEPAVVAPAPPPVVTEPRTTVPEPAVVAPAPPPVVTEPRTTVPEPAVVAPAPPPVVTETRTAVPELAVVAPTPPPAAAETRTAVPEPAVVAPTPPPAVTEIRTAVPEPAVVAPAPPPVVTEPRTAVPEPAVVTPAPPPAVTETRAAVPEPVVVAPTPPPAVTEPRTAVPEPAVVAPAPPPAGGGGHRGPCHGVQVGAFESEENASLLGKRLSADYQVSLSRHQHPRSGPIHRVVVGCTDRPGAEVLQKALRTKDISGFVVQIDPAQ